MVTVAVVTGACGGGGGRDGGDGPDVATVAFDLASPLAGATFWDLPFPSDLRLDAEGRPDVSGFPNPRGVQIVTDLGSLAAQRTGFSLMPIAYFRFTAGAPAKRVADLVPASEAILVDIDPTSPERGTTFPIVAQTLPVDAFAPDTLVAIAPRPGIVLRASTRYAVVLEHAFAPAVETPVAFASLAAGEIPPGARGAAAAALYAPLFAAITPDDALVATVFTTGDQTAVLHARSEGIRTQARAVIADLHVEPGTPATRDGFCALAGTVTFPQYQTGIPPFDAGGGTFVLDGAGIPVAQSTLAVPLRITLPTRTMPAAGWPLWQYFHGSGGASFDIVDEGPTPPPGEPVLLGQGPGAVVARHGIAAAASALPVNPERIPGASSTAYLNLSNLAAFPHTFQQGVFEQRLLLDALLGLAIEPALLASACPGVQLPAGATSHHFDPTTLTAGGHSMGGMYTNMIGAVEPRFGALTPFGAGGFWNLMILETQIVPSAPTILGGILDVDAEQLTFVHPVLGLLGLAWEIAEPGAAMSRIIRRPLAGLPARHVYEPIGLDDVFFPNDIFDAAALAYGNQQAGEVVWPETQAALATDHLDGVLPYPVTANHAAQAGAGITAVTVQYADDGIVDAHQIFRQLAAVKAQYGCFLATYIATGTPTVIAPDASCPATPARR